MCQRKYTLNKTTGRIQKNGINFNSIGATLYLFHTSTDGYHRRLIAQAVEHGFTSVRAVLMFEGASAIEEDGPWTAVESVLQIAEEMDVAVTVEVVSAVILWLERKHEDPYSETYDELFEYVIKRSVKQYSEYSSLFLFTILNEVLPFKGAGFELDPMMRRLLKCAELYKQLDKELLIGSGGLLHLSRKSGGLPAYGTFPWIDEGKTMVPYWQGVYSAPNVDIGMIHIYSSIEKIKNNQSEWDNVAKYTEFCLSYQRGFICDEFGHKTEIVKTPPEKLIIEKDYIDFLNAIGSVLKLQGPVNKLPSMLQYWNHSINAQGYDYWPPFTPPIFDAFEAVFEDELEYDMPNKKAKHYTFNPWKSNGSIILNEKFLYPYDFSAAFNAKKILSVSGKDSLKVKQVVAEIFLDPIKNVPCSITFRFQLRVRDLFTNKSIYSIQSYNSWRQNQVVPTPEFNKPSKRQYAVARLNLDFPQNLRNDNEEQYQVEWVDVYITKFKTLLPAKGCVEIRNLKLLT